MDVPDRGARPTGMVGVPLRAVIGKLSEIEAEDSLHTRVLTELPRVTVINDDPDFLALIGDILTSDRFVAMLLDEDGPDALERAGKSNPDVLMIDLRRGVERLHGWDIAQALRRDPELAQLSILVCSGDYQAMEELEDRAAADTHVELLRKPFALDQLTDAIHRLMDRRVPA